MRLLYIGDIMGPMGMATVEKILPELKASKKIDVVIAQVENLSDGKGMRPADLEAMRAAGVDAFTGGNWSWAKEEAFPILEDPSWPIVRPANYADITLPGRGSTIFETPVGKVLLINVLGQIVGFNQPETKNPLHVIDAILSSAPTEDLAAIVVDFHGDFSSEKLVVGQYLDGRATLVAGDHWHIPTADAMVFPKGTAHISDVGMVGSLDSCLGVKTEVITQRWLKDHRSKNVLETEGRAQFCAVIVDTEPGSFAATSITQVIKYLDSVQ